jgi:exonuclease SbcD
VWDYVALGHIHYHQDLNVRSYPPVVYSGSIERIDFGEEGDPKGFCWVQLERGATTYEFVELNARPFVTIRVDVRGEANPTQAVIDEIARYDIEEAVVRVEIKIGPESEPLLRDREIEAALTPAAFVAAIRRDIDYPVRARLGVERPEGLGPIELLERYLAAKGIDPQRIELLKLRGISLFTGEDQ